MTLLSTAYGLPAVVVLTLGQRTNAHPGRRESQRPFVMPNACLQPDDPDHRDLSSPAASFPDSRAARNSSMLTTSASLNTSPTPI
jgi:hypothetical protein